MIKMSISILIPSNKKTINFPSVPYPVLELLTSDVKGITRSRLDLIKRAKGDIIVMMDDDVKLNPIIWLGVKNLKRGQFIISGHRGRGATFWFLAIHRDDYENVGISSEFNYNADYDFYFRALRRGLIPLFADRTLVNHIPHKRKDDIFREIESGKLRANYPQLIEPIYFKRWVWILMIRLLSLSYFLMLRTFKSLIYRQYRKYERAFRNRNLVLRPSFKVIKKRFKDKEIVGCEIGVFKGDHSYSILNKLPNIKRLYLVDPYMEYFDYSILHSQSKMSEAEMIAHQRLKKFDSRVTWIKSSFKANLIPEPLDFIYIDGDHSYEAVLSDINESKKIVKPNGVIAGHDYYLVTNSNRKLFGVGRAVEETFREFKNKFNDWWVIF